MNAAREYVWLAIALCIGAIAIFWRLTDASPFLDEAFTLSVAAQPVPQLLALVASSDNSPPLFHLLTHALLWLHLASWDYRWFVAPFGFITIAAAWGIAQQLFGGRAAGVAALVTATSPLLVDWDRMYRMYAPFVALSVLSWWLLLLMREGPAGPRLFFEETDRSRRTPILATLYVACAASLPLLHYVGIGVLASQAAYALVRPRARRPVALALVVGALGLAAWVPGLREQFGRGGSLVLSNAVYWPGLALNLFAAYLPESVTALRPWVEWFMSALVLGIVAAALWRGGRTPLPLMLAPALAQIGVSALIGKNLVNPRYLLYVQPLFAVCVGCVAASSGRMRLAGIAAALVVLGCDVAGLQNLLLDPYYQRTDWYAVAALLVTKEQPDDAIVLDQGYMHYVVDDLNGFRGHPTFRIDSSASVQEVRAWLQTHHSRRVWYVENQFYYPDPTRAVFAFLQATRPALGTYQQRRSSPGDSASVVLFGPAR